MTLFAFDEPVFGVDGPEYKVGPRCANPTCPHYADHAHHIVRRSKLGKPYAWVETADGEVLGNLTGLCADCHEDVTGTIGGYRAAIRYLDGSFMWCKVKEYGAEIEYEPIGLLRPQPPTPDSPAAEPPPSESESDVCPTCGHKERRRGSHAPGPRRPRKTWTVKVPDDQENGAEVLDTLVEDIAMSLGYDDPQSALRRYHALVPSLYWVAQNKQQFVREVEEAAS